MPLFDSVIADMMNYNEVNITVTPSSAQMNGEDIAWGASDRGILYDLYQKYAKGYAKFYKMDTLSQLGFIAAEILLQHYPLTPQQHDDCAIMFGNSCASIKNDKDYLQTISDPNSYYPSPSLFVYTLPNIVTGEIAIRHKLYGETCFYVLENKEQLFELADHQLRLMHINAALIGWVECENENNFYANIKLLWKN